MQRLALWAASRGLDPSFTAMVFEPCDRVLGHEQKGSQSQGLELFLGNSESNVW